MNQLNCRISILLLAPALLLGACGSSGESSQSAAVGQEGNAPVQPATPPQAASAENVQPETAALREFIDPATGQPREPTAEELKALANAKEISAPNAGIDSRPKNRETVRPNGVIAVEMDAMSETKGCVQKDGRVVVDHDCKSNIPTPGTKP